VPRLAQNEQVQRVSDAGMSPSTVNAILPQWQLPVIVMLGLPFGRRSKPDTNPASDPRVWNREWSKAASGLAHRAGPDRVSCRAAHLAAPEMPDRAVALGKYAEARHVGIVGADVVTGEVAFEIRI